jgi:5'-3' exonuclease
LIANVDTDVLIYRSGFGCKGDFLQTVELLEGFLQSINEKVDATSSKLILSGATNFRKEIDPNYKISRKDSQRPRYYRELRDYAVNELGAFLSVDCEADDVLGMEQREDTIICSNDKDLLQIPGYHLRFKKNWSDNEIIHVTEDESWFHFFKQVLMGDAVDDIEGLKGIGDAKSTKLLTDKSKQEMLEICQEMYRKEFGEKWFEIFDKNCRLLWIQRNNGKQYYDLL